MGQFVINPGTGEIRHVTPEEYSGLSDVWKQTSPNFDQLKAAGAMDAAGVAQISGVDQSKAWQTPTSGQYVFNPTTDEVEFITGQNAETIVKDRFSQGWISPNIDTLKDKGLLKSTGEVNFDTRESWKFGGRSPEVISAQSELKKYGNDPIKALASGVSDDTIKKAGFDLDKTDDSGQSVKQWFNNLSAEDKLIIKSQGIEDFNKFQQARQEKFEADTVKVGPGEDRVYKTFYESLAQESQKRLNEIGVEKFNAETKAEQQNYTTSLANIEKLSGVKGESDGKSTYDLVAAVRGGASDDDIRTVFGEESLTSARKQERALSEIEHEGGFLQAVKNGVHVSTFMDAGYDVSDYKDTEQFVKDNVQDPESKEWYPKDWVDTMAKNSGVAKATLEKTFKESGMAGVNSILGGEQYENTMAEAEFKRQNVEVAPDKWVSRAYYEGLSEKEQKTLTKAYNTEVPATLEFDEGSRLPNISKDQALAIAYMSPSEAKTYFEQMDKDAQVDFLLDRNLKPSQAVNFDKLSDEKQAEMVQQWQNIVNRAYNPKTWKQAAVGTVTEGILPLVPIVGSYIAVKERGVKSGWSIVSILGDLSLIAGPAIKAGSAALKTTSMEAAIARNTEEFANTVGKAVKSTSGEKAATELTIAFKDQAKAQATYMQDLAAVNRDRSKLIDSITQSRVIPEAGVAEMEPSAKMLSTAELGLPERALAHIPTSDVKMVVSNYDKAVLKAQMSEVELAKAASRYDSMIEKYSTSGKIGEFTTTELARYGESPSIIRTNISGGYLRPAIVADDPRVIEAMRTASANIVDSTRAAYEAYVRPLTYNVSKIDSTLVDLKEFIRTYGRGLNDRSLAELQGEINKLEAMRYEGLVESAGKSVKQIPKYVDQVGELQQEIAKANKVISTLKTSGAPESTVQKATVLKDQMQSLFAEMIEKGTYPIYEASKLGKGTELIVVDSADMYTKALSLDRLLSPAYISQLTAANKLPSSSVKLLTGLKDSLAVGNEIKTLRILDDIDKEMESFKPAKPTVGDDDAWQVYLDKYRTHKKDSELVRQQTEYVRQNLAQVQELARTTETIKSSPYTNTSLSAAIQDKSMTPAMERLMTAQKKQTLIAVLDKDPLREARLAELQRLFDTADPTVKTARIGKPATAAKAVVTRLSRTDKEIQSEFKELIDRANSRIAIAAIEKQTQDATGTASRFVTAPKPANALRVAPTPAPEPNPRTSPKSSSTPSAEPTPYTAPEAEPSTERLPDDRPGRIPREPDRTSTDRSSDTVAHPSSPRLPDAEIESAKGVPDNPGEDVWKQGFTWITAKPPGPDDTKKGGRGEVRITIEKPEDASTGKGSPQDTLFSRGKPAKEVVVRIGNQRATLTGSRGRRKISFNRITGNDYTISRREGKRHERETMRR
ncbi:MAG: hypothetical protein PHV74_06700 [Dehalococcoidia bacterium]|nr:hypothetical protein [Dehalococcoidia bacterium]